MLETLKLSVPQKKNSLGAITCSLRQKVFKTYNFKSYHQEVVCHLYKKDDRMEAVGCLEHFKILKRNKFPPQFSHLHNQYGIIKVKINGSYSLM